MLIKAGVDISRLGREMRRGLNAIGRSCKAFDGEMVITSTYEGNHSDGSLHYANLAVDVRYPPKRLGFVKYLRGALGGEFDVVDERDHVHIEFDPKGKAGH